MIDPRGAQGSGDDERFTRRLEAFSDLVFGFSLSLLAARLDVPSSAAEILNGAKIAAFVITFGIICALWLEHYRIFRHHFVARPFEVIVNFIFLFGLASLPYALLTFLRFGAEPKSLDLYFGDIALILTTLSTLRLRGLRQRGRALDESTRLREWRRVVSQYALALILALLVAATAIGWITPRALFGAPALVIAVFVFALRRIIRRLPAFLSDKPSSNP